MSCFGSGNCCSWGMCDCPSPCQASSTLWDCPCDCKPCSSCFDSYQTSHDCRKEFKPVRFVAPRQAYLTTNCYEQLGNRHNDDGRCGSGCKNRDEMEEHKIFRHDLIKKVDEEEFKKRIGRGGGGGERKSSEKEDKGSKASTNNEDDKGGGKGKKGKNSKKKKK
ncbi:hypothetical protein HELRODRAFT_178103 [Helobdella robusta]|uniref:Uncharacterized protein n=1 Tax=Helobdella robusta TaxID=6412 RepID=T1FCR1_HELRO|nr:hypothetical protein HELRODRAFT_178103 [Helobdella robusta]ESN97318.1 hypothetical protein HELRODRAFT_178103 [Helobdella robusta]